MAKPTLSESLSPHRAVRRRFVLPALLLVSAAAAGGILFRSTPHGLGVNPDSVVYFTTARNIVEGRGFYEFGKPLVLHGAGYPALLSVVFRFGDEMLSARFLHAFILGLNVFLVGLAAARFTRGSRGAVLLAVLLFLASQHVWGIHVLAWSEGPFLAMLLASSLLLARFVASGRGALLVLSGALLGLAIWTRFLGATFLPAAALVLLLLGPRPARERIRSALLFAALAILPIAAWTVRNSLVAGSAAGRALRAHPIGPSHLAELAGAAYEFFLPIGLWAPLEAIQLAAIAALLAGGAIALHRARPGAFRLPEETDVFRFSTFLFLPTCVGTLLFSISFLDALTRIDYRILAPLYPFVVLLAVSLVRNLATETARPLLWKGFALASLFLAAVQADRAIAHVSATRAHGRGYTNEAWRTSEGIGLAGSVDEGLLLYSNAPEAILFLTGREARMLPRPVDVKTMERNVRFSEEVAAIRSGIEAGKAAVFFFNEVRRERMPAAEEFARLFGRAPARTLADAVLFAAPGVLAISSPPAGPAALSPAADGRLRLTD